MRSREDRLDTEMPADDIDLECRALVSVMNRFPGIRTIESCSGYGRHLMRIFFLATPEALPTLVYWFSACHSGVHGWRVTVSTDCARSPVTFCAESTSVGAQAHREAVQIAEAMLQEFEDEIQEE